MLVFSDIKENKYSKEGSSAFVLFKRKRRGVEMAQWSGQNSRVCLRWDNTGSWEERQRQEISGQAG